MIPVGIENYIMIDLNIKPVNSFDKKYYELLRNQLDWLNANSRQVKNKAIKLYDLYNQNRLAKNIKERCCNFKLLERRCKEYTSLRE